MMLPYQNTGFSMSIYSDYSDNLKSFTELTYNLNINLSQTIDITDGMNLHDVIKDISHSFDGLCTESISSFSFSMNPVWNNPEQYNVYLNFSVKGDLDTIVTAYDNLDLSQFSNPIIEPMLPMIDYAIPYVDCAIA